MEFNMGKVGINLGGWYGIYLGGKGSLFVYKHTSHLCSLVVVVVCAHDRPSADRTVVDAEFRGFEI